ncbi:MAG: enoyl-CoA hydratase [Candidatus Pelagibacter sp.]|nr:enoyl-CoA hydratase [Candidatus Pelagibacter sp.]|tara:strand:+ start:16533 stop:17339 length:807 start_codon:yes stop_codon:yes gene_type:complete
MKDTSKNIVLIDSNDIGVLRLTLNDPDNKNALSEFMMQKLINAITEASKDNSVKVIVIASTGNVFCSGHNLKEIKEARRAKDSGESYYLELFKTCSYLMQLIVNCSKPVIAEVNGIATAAGCQLVASCDLAVSSKSAKFATPGVNIGLFCSTPMVALSRNVSKKDSMKMLLTGDMINADEAKRISLINDFVTEEELTESVMDLAEKISKKSAAVIAIGKKAFYKQAELNLFDAYEYTSRVMAENTLKDDAKEGIESFLEKRDPNWSDS